MTSVFCFLLVIASWYCIAPEATALGFIILYLFRLEWRVAAYSIQSYKLLRRAYKCAAMYNAFLQTLEAYPLPEEIWVNNTYLFSPNEQVYDEFIGEKKGYAGWTCNGTIAYNASCTLKIVNSNPTKIALATVAHERRHMLQFCWRVGCGAQGELATWNLLHATTAWLQTHNQWDHDTYWNSIPEIDARAYAYAVENGYVELSFESLDNWKQLALPASKAS